MTKFFVGQAVRILFSSAWPELRGCTGRIVATVDDFEAGDEIGCDYEVAPDHWGTSESPDGKAIFAPNSSQLEPILPEGAQPSKFSFQELLEDLNERSCAP